MDKSSERPRHLGSKILAILPIAQWLPRYDRSRLRGDLTAGAIVAALMIPQSLGYARIAGVPVEVGLYAVPLALLAYAVLGSSPQLIVGPASTVAIVSGSLVADISADNPEDVVAITSALAIAAGIVLIAIGLLRVAWVAEFLSKSIVTGFVFGLTLTIVVGELPTLLGVPKPSGDLIGVFVGTVRDIADLDPTTAIVGGSALLLILGGRRISSRVPWGLVTLIGAVVASRLLDLESEGVSMIGEVPGGLPPLQLPIIPRDDLGAVVIGGASLALVAMAEGLAATRLFATRGGYRVETEYELVGMGASNIGAGLTGGLGVAGSLSKTASAEQAGSHSQVTGLAAAGLVVVVLLAFTWFFTDLPQAVLSAIVVAAVWGLMDVAALRRFLAVRRADFVAAMVAIAGVVLFGPLPGLGIAIATSLLAIIYRSSSPRMEVLGRISGEKAAWGRMRSHTTRRTVPGIVVVRLDAPLFWANAIAIEDRLVREVGQWEDTHSLVLDLEATSQLDTTSADMIEHLHSELAAQGVTLYLARVIHPVSAVLERSGCLSKLGDEHIWHSISQCVRAARKAHSRRQRDGEATEDRPATEDDQLATATGDTDAVDSDSYAGIAAAADRGDEGEAEIGEADDTPSDETMPEADDEVEVIDDEEEDEGIYGGYGAAGSARDRAIDWYLRAYRDGQPEAAAAAHLAPNVVQHSTGIRDGIDGSVAAARRFAERNSDRYLRVVRSIADRRFVVLHTFQSLNGGRDEYVTVNFFATDDDDRIAEHWEVVAPHTQEKWTRVSETDGPTEAVDLDRTSDNREIVRGLFEQVLLRQDDPGRIDAFVSEQYIEHNTAFVEGRGELRDLAWAAAGPLRYDELVLLAAEGNFVATLCRARRAGTPVAHVDILRLENGLVVEHWDNTENVPPEDEWVNSGMF